MVSMNANGADCSGSAPDSSPSASTDFVATLRGAIWIVAALTAASGVLVAARMYETHTPNREEGTS